MEGLQGELVRLEREADEIRTALSVLERLGLGSPSENGTGEGRLRDVEMSENGRPVEASPPSDSVREYPCSEPACGFVGKTEAGLKSHERSHRAQTTRARVQAAASHRCAVDGCGWRGHSEQGLKVHIGRMHPQPAPEKSNPTGRSNYVAEDGDHL